MVVLRDGNVKLAGKGRGLPGAYVTLFKLAEKQGGIDEKRGILVGYTYDTKGSEPIQRYLTGNMGLPAAPLCHVGPTIGTHVGPRCSGIAFFAKHEDLG